MKRDCWQVDQHSSVRHSREGSVVQRQETKEHVGRNGVLGIYCLDRGTKSGHFLHKMIECNSNIIFSNAGNHSMQFQLSEIV